MSEINAKWNTEECVKWVKTLKLPEKHESKIIAAIEENETEGQDLIDMTDASEIEKNFGVIPLIAKKFLRKLNDAKPTSVDDILNFAPKTSPNQWSTNDDNTNNNNYNNKMEDNKVDEPSLNFSNAYGNTSAKYEEFSITFTKGQKIAILPGYTKGVKFSTVIARLKEEQSWATGSGINYVYNSKPIGSEHYGKTLGQLNITPNARNNAYISIVSKMIGGAKMKNDKLMERQFTQEYVKKYYKLLKPMLTVKDKDIISLDDSKRLRAKMPCGHAISPLSMYNYVDNQLRYDHVTKIYCPVNKCKKEWDFDLCSIVGCMTEKEYSKFSRVIQDRVNPQKKRCPTCETEVARPKDLIMLRVNCGGGCGDFCFLCLEKWKSSSMTICGNIKCATYQINKALKECKLINLRRKIDTVDGKPVYKDMDYNVKLPELRACVYCLSLIEYTEQCKHMTCQECKNEFCFSCLRKYDKKTGSFGCKGAFDQCPDDKGNPGYVAPRQQL